MGGRANDLWPLSGLDTGGLPSRLVLGAVVSPRLPPEKGEHLAQHQAALGPVLGDGGPREGAQVTFSATEILSMVACCSLGHVGGPGEDLTSSIFCPVFLRTSILGNVFPISFVSRKGCNGST